MKKIALIIIIAIATIGVNAQFKHTFIADINKTPIDSDHIKPVEFNGKLYMAGGVVHSGYKYLYEYDGNNVPSIAKGVVVGSHSVGRNPLELVVFKNHLYFSGYKNLKGVELMKYDGVNAPTMVADINNNGQASSRPKQFTVMNNKLYFTANYLDKGIELWEYDGTNAPKMVMDIYKGANKSSNPSELIAYKNKLYFSANNGIEGNELWEYDGINAPKMYNLRPTSKSSSPHSFAIFRDTLYFSAIGADNISDLYKFSQGDSFELAHIVAGPRRHIYPRGLTVFNKKLYFSGKPRFGQYGLMEYDGINNPKLAYNFNTFVYNLTSVTTMVKTSVSISIIPMLYFSVTSSIFGLELWKYDGINTPTMVVDMKKGKLGSNPEHLTSFKNKLIYVATDTISGIEIREYDGTNPPKILIDFSEGTKNSNIRNFVEYNGKMYFSATSLNSGYEMWEYDGIKQPKMAFDLYPGIRSSSPGKGVVYKNKLYFPAKVKSRNSELVEYDGISPPKVVTHIMKNSFGGRMDNLFVFKDKIYFQARSLDHGFELWSFNGDTAKLVADINPGYNGSSPSGFKIYKDKLYFTALHPTKGNELWVYDGTNPPSMVYDINPNGNGYPAKLTIYKDVLYFTASDGTNRYRDALWSYDGINNPTKITKSKIWGISAPMMVYKNQLYLAGWANGDQPELYKFDGTNAPTLVANIHPQYGSSPNHFTLYKNKLFFTASSPTLGREIRSYNGTDVVTYETIVGSKSTSPNQLFKFKNKLYYSGFMPKEGQELWSFEEKSIIGIHKVNNIEGIIYPNPTSNNLTIEIDEHINKVEIYNYNGAKVMEQSNHSFSVAQLSTGLYIINIHTDKGILRKRFVKH